MKILQFFKRRAVHPADANMERYLRWLKNYDPKHTDKKPDLQRIYVDRSNNNWYLHSDRLSMTEGRAAAIDEALQRVEYNMEPEEHNQRLTAFGAMAENIETFINNGETEKAVKLTKRIRNDVSDIMYRISALPRAELMIELALIYFVIDDENPYYIDTATQSRKRDVVNKDGLLRDFFLKTSFDIFKATTKIDGAGFLRYLHQKQAELQRRRNVAISKAHTRNNGETV